MYKIKNKIKKKVSQRNLGKKGMFLSLIALLVVMMFVFMITLQNMSVASAYKDEVVKTRVNIVDDYIKSLFEVYIPTAAEIATYNALDYIATHSWTIRSSDGTTIIEQGPVNYGNLDDDFVQGIPFDSVDRWNLIRFGYYTIGSDKVYAEELEKGFLQLWIDQIEDISNQYLGFENIEITLIPHENGQNIKLTQQDPWNINVSFNVQLDIDAGLAEWHTTKLIETKVSIIGLHDKMVIDEWVKKDYISKNKPSVYVPDPDLINALPKIEMTENELSFDWKKSDDKSLERLGEINTEPRQYYTHYPKSSSYLQRLKGDPILQSECCGITSFIDQIAEDVNVCSPPESFLGYCYYNGYTDEDSGCGPNFLYCPSGSPSMIISVLQAKFFNVDGKCASSLSEDVTCN